MSVRVVVSIDSAKLNYITEQAIEVFKNMEANCLVNVDLEACCKDYIRAVLMFNETVFTAKLI